MPLPADSQHVTDDSGQLCTGHICSICAACANCGKRVGTPHVELCECPDNLGHYICDACEQALDRLGIL